MIKEAPLPISVVELLFEASPLSNLYGALARAETTREHLLSQSPSYLPSSNVSTPTDCASATEAARRARLQEKRAGELIIQPGSWDDMTQRQDEYMRAGAEANRLEQIAAQLCGASRQDFIVH